MYRTDKTPILFEIKDYNRNIPTEEINKFIRVINGNNYNNLLICLKMAAYNGNYINKFY
jgi:hypothetical protein